VLFYLEEQGWETHMPRQIITLETYEEQSLYFFKLKFIYIKKK